MSKNIFLSYQVESSGKWVSQFSETIEQLYDSVVIHEIYKPEIGSEIYDPELSSEDSGTALRRKLLRESDVLVSFIDREDAVIDALFCYGLALATDRFSIFVVHPSLSFSSMIWPIKNQVVRASDSPSETATEVVKRIFLHAVIRSISSTQQVRSQKRGDSARNVEHYGVELKKDAAQQEIKTLLVDIRDTFDQNDQNGELIIEPSWGAPGQLYLRFSLISLSPVKVWVERVLKNSNVVHHFLRITRHLYGYESYDRGRQRGSAFDSDLIQALLAGLESEGRRTR